MFLIQLNKTLMNLVMLLRIMASMASVFTLVVMVVVSVNGIINFYCVIHSYDHADIILFHAKHFEMKVGTLQLHKHDATKNDFWNNISCILNSFLVSLRHTHEQFLLFIKKTVDEFFGRLQHI